MKAFWQWFVSLFAQGTPTAPIVVAPVKPVTPPKTMNTVTITRTKDDGKETIGSLVATRESDSETFSCDTLELPWLENQHDISCIPKGTYYASLRAFHQLQRYELLTVPGRDGIFIHDGNYYKDTLGCILLGEGFLDINGDGEIDIAKTVVANEALIAFMSKQSFTLIIQ